MTRRQKRLAKRVRARLCRGRSQHIELRKPDNYELVTAITGASKERQRAILDGREPTPEGFGDWLRGLAGGP